MLKRSTFDRNQLGRSQVTKKLKPGPPGTLRLLERLGRQLLCVRYRKSPDGRQRIITAELIISVRPIRQREVALEVGPEEKELRALLIQHGAR